MIDQAAVWDAVADERVALADLLGGIDDAAWDEPSRCGGWRVREVVAHLVFLAEASRRSMLVDALWARSTLNRGVDKLARRLAAAAKADELVARLRAAAGGRFVAPGLAPAVALGEVLVHRADIADAAGLPPHAADERLRAVLDAERRLWWAFGAPRAVRKVLFSPTDGDWTVGPADGRRVEGPGEQLLLATTGRPGATHGLTGPGVALLA